MYSPWAKRQQIQDKCALRSPIKNKNTFEGPDPVLYLRTYHPESKEKQLKENTYPRPYSAQTPTKTAQKIQNNFILLVKGFELLGATLFYKSFPG